LRDFRNAAAAKMRSEAKPLHGTAVAEPLRVRMVAGSRDRRLVGVPSPTVIPVTSQPTAHPAAGRAALAGRGSAQR